MSEQKQAPLVTPLGNGRYAVRAGETQRVAFAVPSGAGTWVFLDGRTYLIEAAAGPSARARGRASHDDATALSSPMPATVLAVNVEPGQQVARGDVLLRLEAMKMELPIKAPRDGRVKAVACRAGELVQSGVPLLELE